MALCEACCAWPWKDRQNHTAGKTPISLEPKRPGILSAHHSLSNFSLFTSNTYQLFIQSMASIESTVGVDCKTISLANGEVMVWDFAGQLEYVTTHQFFLSKEVYI